MFTTRSGLPVETRNLVRSFDWLAVGRLGLAQQSKPGLVGPHGPLFVDVAVTVAVSRLSAIRSVGTPVVRRAMAAISVGGSCS